jgi:hypothetical protein
MSASRRLGARPSPGAAAFSAYLRNSAFTAP